jgi:phage N-6-adenine-methyltransferase
MGKMDVHFSSDSAEWETPDELFSPLNNEFNFTLDVCASIFNNKCQLYLDMDCDGLEVPWDTDGFWWCNPPYGKGIINWVRKATEETLFGNPGVMLLPARTDTKWWSYIWSHKTHRPRKWVKQIRFLKGRVKFVGAPASAPFPSVIVVFQRPFKLES